MQKFSDAPLSECPQCQGDVKKLMSLSSFALKGSGWYTTDYKRAGSKTPGSESGKDSDSKPASEAVAASGEKSGSDSTASVPKTAATPSAGSGASSSASAN